MENAFKAYNFICDLNSINENSRYFNPEQICQIEEATRGQSGNTEWFVHRKCIITASFIFSSVKHFRFTPCLDIYF